LVVAAITVFIVIFINAITRRKYIGIMKAIGVDGKTLELSYVFQSMVYAIIGSIIGLAMVYGFLVPYVAANPIDFPFSDGILVAPVDLTMVRVGILLFVTAIAGYLPARIIIKKNTLDSILGRD
jgi:cell division transport system permease protein